MFPSLYYITTIVLVSISKWFWDCFELVCCWSLYVWFWLRLLFHYANEPDWRFWILGFSYYAYLKLL
jgi:hypothetical protein